MYPPGIVLVLLDLPGEGPGLLLTLGYLVQNPVELKADLADSRLNVDYFDSRLLILLISMSI